MEVVVKNGKLTSVAPVAHRESAPGAALKELPARIVAAKGTAGVDAITGATVTSRAVLSAVDKALEQAR